MYLGAIQSNLMYRSVSAMLFATAILLTLANGSIAQSTAAIIDSLESKSSQITGDTAYIETLMSYVWDHARKDRGVSYHFLEKVQAYSDSTGIAYKREKMIYYRGVLLKNDRKFHESEEYFKEFQKLKIARKDTQWMAACHNVLLNLYVDMREFEKATLEAERAVQLYEVTSDTVGIVRVQSRIGTLLGQFGNLAKGLQYVQEAYHLGKNIKDYETYSYVINDMGYNYEMQEKYDTSVLYYEEFRDYTMEHDMLTGLAYAHFNLGTVKNKSGLLQEAIAESELALEAAVNTNDQGMQAAATFLKGTILADLEKYDEAYQLMKEVPNDDLALEEQSALYNVYYRYFKKQNNAQQALHYHEQWKEVTDSLKNVSITKAVSEVEARYESERKDAEIETLGLKDELNQSKIKGRNRWIGLLGLGLACMAFLLYRIVKQKQVIGRQKEQLTVALADKNVLLKEIHHRVKNNLQVISSLLGLQSRYVDDDVAQDVLKVSKSRVQSMALLHQKLYSNKDLKTVNVKQYFEDLVSNLMSTYQVNEGEITFQMDVDDLLLDIDTIVPIGLITNELISNTLKHAFTDQDGGSVSVSLKEVANNYILKVSDDGKGLPFDKLPQRSQSLGIQLIKSFADKLGGTVSVASPSGAEFIITIPA